MLELCACTAAQPEDQGAGASQGPTWQEQYDLGVRYLSEGNYEEAILAFTAAIEIDPKRAPAYVGRGDAYVSTAKLAVDSAASDKLSPIAAGAYQSALADYLSAINLDGSDASLYRKAAEIYVIQGEIESAKELLRRGIEAIEDEDLQTYLEKLEKLNSLFVLVREDIYRGDQHSWSVYTYDELGYQIGWDIWNDDGQKECSMTWVYDKDQNVWNKTSTVQNGEVTIEKVKLRTTDTVDYLRGYGTHTSYAHTHPFDPVCGPEGFTAEYTYDENGNTTRIDTYNSDGKLSGYCLLKWEKIESMLASK